MNKDEIVLRKPSELEFSSISKFSFENFIFESPYAEQSLKKMVIYP